MKKKQTSVQWLQEAMQKKLNYELSPSFLELFQQAKAMEKEQMNKASKDLWCEACDYWMNVKTNIKSL